MSLVDLSLERDWRDGMVIEFDDQGEPWRLFAGDYQLEGRTHTLTFFARDGGHARKVIDAIKAGVEVKGPVYEEDV